MSRMWKPTCWCYDQSPNIMTSLEFERILSASGPTSGHLVRPLDQGEHLNGSFHFWPGPPAGDGHQWAAFSH